MAIVSTGTAHVKLIYQYELQYTNMLVGHIYYAPQIEPLPVKHTAFNICVFAHGIIGPGVVVRGDYPISFLFVYEWVPIFVASQYYRHSLKYV